MTSLPEQFSAARKAQFEAGFDIFQSFANQAFESASRVAALNLATSRDTLERSARTATALFASKDPRDLLMLGGHAEEQVRSLFSYGRELMNIAGGIRPYALRAPTQAPAGNDIETVAFKPVLAPAPLPEPVVETPAPAVEAAAPVLAGTPPAEPVVVAEPEPAVELIVTATEPAPVAEPKAIVKAVGKGAARAAVVPHPAAAPIPAADEVETPKVQLAPTSPRRKK
ncbi:phasin family protein [Massilia sp. G4R7]|uniref:Phasin family protein n=1 Tax=Massilia phyllostachyos TaxID=2898585 RepID=A0ABS8Q0X8_9BURK|nr:phasin family protein [Massilia phyllostachyos]MCD2515396.1 phasin family protein [Massilia phyllostachyos]